MNTNRFYALRAMLMIVVLGLTSGCSDQKTLFSLVNPSQSGVHFSNRITESDTLNILDYEYIYNGGGIGIGDFNNDGLPDFFATGNMVDNALYLNKGSMRFEDITKAAGVASSGQWSSGVAVVDINADGWEDIYVCNTTHPSPERRKNNLYINQGTDQNGIPVFIDMAAAYGLDDDTYSVNAAFFDYDNDDDLDVIVIINEMGDTRYHSQYRAPEQRKFYQRIDKLFRNDARGDGHPVFTDVSAEAQINKPGFSLGVNIGDFNKDGWKDIYISNDFLSDDLLYINQKDGTFKELARDLLKHTSHSAMGVDVGDLNNDGYDDIVVLDMLPEDNQRQKRLLGPTNYSFYLNNERFGYSYQYVRNTLQLNNGLDTATSPQFSDISLHAGIAATDWSWAPVIADFDRDGYKDLIVTNGFPKDVTDRDYMEYKSDSHLYASKESMLAQIPSAKVPNYAYRNNGDLTFEDVSAKWGMNFPSYSNGAAYSDLDNDGDLDLVINNINDSLSILQNHLDQAKEKNNYIILKLEGKNPNIEAIGARVKVELEDRMIWHEHAVFRGYLSSHDKRIHIGVGGIQTVHSVEVFWPSGSSTVLNNPGINTTLTISQADAGTKSIPSKEITTQIPLMTIDTSWKLRHVEDDFIDYNIQPLLPHKLSQYGPSLSTGDIDGDGMDELYVGGPAFFNGYIVSTSKSTGSFRIDTLYSHDKRAEELGTLVFDADRDGDNDLFVVTGSYEFKEGDTILQDRFYENIGGRLTLRRNALPPYLSNALCVKGADFDGDGDIDLFVGGRVVSGKYPEPPQSILLENVSSTESIRFVLSEKIPGLETLGMVTDALWTDVNNDDLVDLIVVGEFMEITTFINKPPGFERTIYPSLKNLKGMWNSIAAGDFDKDGDVDYVVGNLGTNTFTDISSEHPYRIYVNDFDKNGSKDALPFGYLKDEKGKFREYPLSAKMDLVSEINEVRRMYPTHHEYSYVDRKKMITAKTMRETVVYEMNTPHSLVLINNGNDLMPRKLPHTAQLAPLYGMAVLDVNHDGHLDILAVGNDFGSELIYGRMDALNGLVLLGDGAGHFQSLNMGQSGFYVPGDGKSLTILVREEIVSLITGMNKGPLSKFDLTLSPKYIKAEADDCRALMYEDDTFWVQELYYGHSFLSQQPRILFVPDSVNRIEIIKSTGDKRTLDTIN